ncbi:flavin reductase family protein [Bacillus songklensis]|uniref:Flavin reductase family protein n=1 Tax=Bacillus songklensis TaxID=1069116 RepID=A0ABV8B837_9BACI
MDDRMFRNAMGKFATGVTVITTEVEDQVHGMTANAFMSVSLNPKLVLISIGEKAKMRDRIRQSKTYAVSFLAENQKEVSMQFAGQIKEEREFEFDWLNDMPVIKDALGVLTCNVVGEHEAGDHTLFIGEVTDIRLKEEVEPLVFYQGKYRELTALKESIPN